MSKVKEKDVSIAQKPKPFLGRDPASIDPPWREHLIQAYIVQEARRVGYLVHGDQNGAAKSGASASLAKVTGMQAGWPDLVFAVPMAPIWIEMKLIDGRLSKDRKDIHAHTKAIGYVVHTVYAESPRMAGARSGRCCRTWFLEPKRHNDRKP